MGVNEVMVTNHYIFGLQRLAISIGHMVSLDDDHLDVALRLARGAAAQSQSEYGEITDIGMSCQVCNIGIILTGGFPFQGNFPTHLFFQTPRGAL